MYSDEETGIASLPAELLLTVGAERNVRAHRAGRRYW